jgi:hypothetical protein
MLLSGAFITQSLHPNTQSRQQTEATRFSVVVQLFLALEAHEGLKGTHAVGIYNSALTDTACRSVHNCHSRTIDADLIDELGDLRTHRDNQIADPRAIGNALVVQELIQFGEACILGALDQRRNVSDGSKVEVQARKLTLPREESAHGCHLLVSFENLALRVGHRSIPDQARIVGRAGYLPARPDTSSS